MRAMLSQPTADGEWDLSCLSQNRASHKSIEWGRGSPELQAPVLAKQAELAEPEFGREKLLCLYALIKIYRDAELS